MTEKEQNATFAFEGDFPQTHNEAQLGARQKLARRAYSFIRMASTAIKLNKHWSKKRAKTFSARTVNQKNVFCNECRVLEKASKYVPAKNYLPTNIFHRQALRVWKIIAFWQLRVITIG
jgi:hypothetical protein